MPLQLMIMVIVAGLGTAILVGWMGGLSAPEAIASVNGNPTEILLSDGDGDGTFENDDVTLTIIVRDQNGDPVEGASVVLDGCEVRNSDGSLVYGTTGSEGKVTFDGLSVSVRAGHRVHNRDPWPRGHGHRLLLQMPVMSR